MLLMYESLFQPRWNQATNPVCNLIRYHDMTHYLNSQTSWVGLKMICNCIVSSSHHRTSLLDLIIITITQHSNSGCFPVLQEGVNTWVISTRCPALCSLYVRQEMSHASCLTWSGPGSREMFPGPCPTHNWAGSGRCQGPGRCLQITQGTSPWQRGEWAQWAGRQAQSTHTNDRCSDASPSHLSTSQFSLLHLLACSYTKQRNSWRWQSCLLTPLSMITPKLPSLGWNSHSALTGCG